MGNFWHISGPNVAFIATYALALIEINLNIGLWIRSNSIIGCQFLTIKGDNPCCTPFAGLKHNAVIVITLQYDRNYDITEMMKQSHQW